MRISRTGRLPWPCGGLVAIVLAILTAGACGTVAAQSPFSGGFNPEDMLMRLDVNGNGVLDPEEMQGRARYFLERFAADAHLDLSKPIPLDKMREAVKQRMSSFSSSSSSDGRSRGSGDGDRRDDNDSKKPSAKMAVKPLVPGFGVDIKQVKPRGFGPEDPVEALKAKYDAEIVEQVEDSLRRADENGDGILETSEWRHTRWSSDPREYDKNKDGKLTREEIAERYVARRQSGSSRGGYSRGPSGPGSPSDSSRGPGGPPGGFFGSGGFGGPGGPGGPFGNSFGGPPSDSPSGSPSASPPTAAANSSSSSPAPSLSEKTLSYAEGLIKKYDENKDGVLQKSEWSQMRDDPESADKNKDGQITRQELAEWMASKYKGRDSSSSSSGAAGSGKKSYRFRTPKDRLPSGIPSWFSGNDANGDGQVMMNEYAGVWSESKALEFARYDRNGDGVITSKEAMISISP